MNTLTKEQVLQITTQHDFNIHPNSTSLFEIITLKRVTDMLNAAFALGVAQEREACMYLCEAIALDPYKEQAAIDCARQIRERRRA